MEVEEGGGGRTITLPEKLSSATSSRALQRRTLVSASSRPGRPSVCRVLATTHTHTVRWCGKVGGDLTRGAPIVEATAMPMPTPTPTTTTTTTVTSLHTRRQPQPHKCSCPVHKEFGGRAHTLRHILSISNE